MKNSRVLVFLLVSVGMSIAQHGTAPDGVYPFGYNGDTFTGKLGSVGNDDALTLTYQKKDKTETFTGYLAGGCQVPSVDGRLMHARDIPTDSVITAYYKPETKKVEGVKSKRNIIIGIQFVEAQGTKIRDENRKMYPCYLDTTKK